MDITKVRMGKALRRAALRNEKRPHEVIEFLHVHHDAKRVEAIQDIQLVLKDVCDGRLLDRSPLPQWAARVVCHWDW